MQHQKIVLIGVGVLCIVCCYFWRSHFLTSKTERVEYKTHTGDSEDATVVELEFSAPSSDLSTLATSSIARPLVTGELLSIQGSLVIESNEPLAPLVVQFIQQTEKGDITGNSAVLGPPYDPSNVNILVNCPRTPGKYSLRVQWFGEKNYIAHAAVTVAPSKP